VQRTEVLWPTQAPSVADCSVADHLPKCQMDASQNSRRTAASSSAFTLATRRRMSASGSGGQLEDYCGQGTQGMVWTVEAMGNL
jgi:hypothetical protein